MIRINMALGTFVQSLADIMRWRPHILTLVPPICLILWARGMFGGTVLGKQALSPQFLHVPHVCLNSCVDDLVGSDM